MSAVSLSVEMVFACNCGVCGVPVYMPQAKYDACLRNHSNNFYCCNGHSRVFIGKTEAEKLREELDREKSRRIAAEAARDTATRARAIVSGKLKATKERIHNGVCPCCKRSFQNLRRHMATKHPGFAESEL